GDRRCADRSQGAGAGRRGRVGGALERAAIGGGKTMKTRNAFRAASFAALCGFGLWLAGAGLAFAQNSIESFDVTQQGGKVVVRITTKEPLRSVPPNFTVASPARIAFDFPNTVNALGRSTQE